MYSCIPDRRRRRAARAAVSAIARVPKVHHIAPQPGTCTNKHRAQGRSRHARVDDEQKRVGAAANSDIQTRALRAARTPSTLRPLGASACATVPTATYVWARAENSKPLCNRALRATALVPRELK